MNGQQAQHIEKTAGESEVMEIGFKRLSENAVLPTKAHASDSGFDLYAAEDVIIAPGETAVVPTNIAVKLPEGFEATVRPRSGITSRTKLRVQLGTIDNGYNGDIGVIVDNIAVPDFEYITWGNKLKPRESYSVDTLDGYQGVLADRFAINSYLIYKGDKIAQLVVQPIRQTVAVEITELGESARGEAGFGSSGV